MLKNESINNQQAKQFHAPKNIMDSEKYKKGDNATLKAKRKFGSTHRSLLQAVLDERIHSYEQDDQRVPKTAVLLDGKIVICWFDNKENSNKSLYDVICKIFNSDGTVFKNEIKISDSSSSTNSAFAYYLSVASLKLGGFVVVWQTKGSTNAMFRRIYNQNGTGITSQLLVPNPHLKIFPMLD